MTAFADTVRHARHQRGESTRVFAERLGVSHMQVVRWENGQSVPPLARLSSLAGPLGRTTAELATMIAEAHP